MDSEEEYQLYGDDSSDEEMENGLPKNRESHFVNLIKRRKIPENLRPSVLFLDLGIRILASEKVGDLYFPLKQEKLGRFRLPDDEEIEDYLRTSFRRAIEQILKAIRKTHQNLNFTEDMIVSVQEEIYRTVQYTKYSEKIKSNKRIFLSSCWSKKLDYKKVTRSITILRNKLIKLVNQKVKARIDDSYITREVVTSVRKQNLDNVLEKLKTEFPDFLTEKKEYVSIKKDVYASKQILELHLAHCPHSEVRHTPWCPRTNFPSIRMIFNNEFSVKEALYNAYRYIADEDFLKTYLSKLGFRSKPKNVLLNLANTFLVLNNYNRSLFEQLDFTATIEDALDSSLNEWKGHCLQRPVLPDVYVFALSEDGYDTQHFFSNLRLMHRSTKRSIKNLMEKDCYGYGAILTRSWNFNPGHNIYAQETQTVSSNYVLSSDVLYPLWSSTYKYLFKTVTEIKEKYDFDNRNIVEHVKSTLRYGTLGVDPYGLEQFFTTFTYHLFGAEVVRHPATLIYNLLAFDLIKNYGRDFNIKYFPMSMSGAVDAVRTIQNKVKDFLKFNYDYVFKYAAYYEDRGFRKFVGCEVNLLNEWLNCKNMESLTDLLMYENMNMNMILEHYEQLVEEINRLSNEFYGIEVVLPVLIR